MTEVTYIRLSLTVSSAVLRAAATVKSHQNIPMLTLVLVNVAMSTRFFKKHSYLHKRLNQK